MPSLTILICTHNRRTLLAKALASLDAARRRNDAVWETRLVERRAAYERGEPVRVRLPD